MKDVRAQEKFVLICPYHFVLDINEFIVKGILSFNPLAGKTSLKKSVSINQCLEFSTFKSYIRFQ